MDPKKRLTMEDLKKNEWLLRNNNSLFSEKSLPTPGILNNSSNTIQIQFSATMDAFHKATREGFRLQDVAKAPLARRRKMKKTSEERSESSDSSHSSGSCSTLTQSQSIGSQSISGGVTLSAAGDSGAVTTVCTAVDASVPLSDLQVPTRDSPVRNLSNVSNHSNTSSTSHSSTHSLGFVPQRISPVNIISSQSTPSDFSVTSQDLFVLDPQVSITARPQSVPFQEIRSSSESETLADAEPFQGSRGIKRKHSLEEEDSDIDAEDLNDEDSEEDSDFEVDNECIIIDDDSGSENDAIYTRSGHPIKKSRAGETIVIDD